MNDNKVTDSVQPQDSSPNEIQMPQNIPTEINQKGNTLIIVDLVFLMAIIGAGAYFLRANSNRTSFQPNQTPNTITRTPTSTQIVSPTASALPKNGVSSFISSELGISFNYPAQIGLAKENPASKGKVGSATKGEEWWRIDFDKTGFEPGYYEVSASTANYSPSSWEGAPHYFNAKISETDTEDIVKQKLTEVHYQVVKVQKIKSPSNITAFKVWNLDCYVGCMLSRDYILPVNNTKYGNLQIYTILKSLNAGDENATLEQARNLAENEITKIENGQVDATIKSFLVGQDLILNSLKFTQ